MKSTKTHQGNSLKSKIVCPLCENAHSVQKRSSGEYKIFECKECHGEFSWPINAALDYNEVNEVPTAEQFKNVAEKSLRRNFNYASLITFLSAIQKGTMLDVGSGPGVFMSHAHRLGFECYGTDISDNMVKVLGNNLSPGKFFKFDGKNLNFPGDWPRKFHIISALDVLEHAEDPLTLAKNIYDHVEEGGYFIGSVPNRDRYYYTLGKIIDDFIGGDNPPYHLTFWRKKTVVNFLQKIGFRNSILLKGGLLWRKNIQLNGRYSPILSRFVGWLYKHSARIPVPVRRLIESQGSHLIFIAKKGKNSFEIDDLEDKIYKKQIPFFKDGDIE